MLKKTSSLWKAGKPSREREEDSIGEKEREVKSQGGSVIRIASDQETKCSRKEEAKRKKKEEIREKIERNAAENRLKAKIEKEKKQKERDEKRMRHEIEKGKKLFVGGVVFSDLYGERTTVEKIGKPERKGDTTKVSIRPTRAEEKKIKLRVEERKRKFREIFSKFGKIISFSDTWEKGYFFVVYSSPEEAENAYDTLLNPRNLSSLCSSFTTESEVKEKETEGYEVTADVVAESQVESQVETEAEKEKRITNPVPVFEVAWPHGMHRKGVTPVSYKNLVIKLRHEAKSAQGSSPSASKEATKEDKLISRTKKHNPITSV